MQLLRTLPTRSLELPKGYGSKPLEIDETPGESLEAPAGVSRIFTSVPIKPRNATLKDNPDGWCEVRLDKPQLKKVIFTTCPDFPLPVPHPPKPLQCLKTSSTSGIGMFATADLKMNDLILAERPLIITPAAIGCRLEIAHDTSLTPEQKMLISIQDEEKSLEYSLSRMLPEAQAAFKSLSNSHLEDGSGPLLGVTRTNGFGVTFEGCSDPYSATYDKFSRINHRYVCDCRPLGDDLTQPSVNSCLPNATIKFNMKTFAGELRALRPVKAGQEIYLCYCKIQDSRAERQKDLKKYGFTCTCEVCSSPELEEFRRRMLFSLRKLGPFLDPNKPDSMSKGEFESMATECVSWLKQIEERGFQGSDAYLKHLQVAVTCYNRLGKQNDAVQWGSKWFMIEQAMSGANGVMKVMVIMGAMAPSTLRILQSRAQ